MAASRSQKSEAQDQKSSNSSSKASKLTSEPSSMEELLADTGYIPHGLKKGQGVAGTIVAITPKEILIDVNAKTEGLVLEKDKKLMQELHATLSVGDRVNAVVISPESESGYPILSLRRELMDKNWNMLLSKKEKGEEYLSITKYPDNPELMSRYQRVIMIRTRDMGRGIVLKYLGFLGKAVEDNIIFSSLVFS